MINRHLITLKWKNIQNDTKRTSVEKSLAYETKVLNRESGLGLEGIINGKLQENQDKSSCYRRSSSCLACEANKVLTVSKSVQQSKLSQEPKMR